MNTYPLSFPIILTDDIFIAYGGQSGTTTPAQRSASYLIAEKQASKYIGTLLLPVVVTGTFPYMGSHRIATDYGYVHEVLSVSVLGVNSLTNCTLESHDGCVFVLSDTYAYLDVHGALMGCGECSGPVSAYNYQIAYRAGLPTGTANQPDVLLALTILAEISLNEMIYPRANETAGDVGVESFSSLDYSEKRSKMKRTILGTSARADKAARLLDVAVVKARKALVF